MTAKSNRTLAVVMTLAVLLGPPAYGELTNDLHAPPQPPSPNSGCSVTRLMDGRWLMAGGVWQGWHSVFEKAQDGKLRRRKEFGLTSDASIYDTATGKWADTAPMIDKRCLHTATLLSNGKVLVAGGQTNNGGSDISSTEFYDPSTQTWSMAGALNVARREHRATLLKDGRVLVTGGANGGPRQNILSTAELFDPATRKWTLTGPMKEPYFRHTATLLTNGLVLVAGGFNQNAELYDPHKDQWTMTGSMVGEARLLYTATLLTNGQVLLTTENTNAWLASKELYDPSSGRWKVLGQPRPPRPHFVSSTNLDRTLTISPQSGSSFPASEEIEIMVQSADRFGVTNIQLFRDNVKVAEGEESPLRFTLTKQTAGTYTFLAKAAYANGLNSVSSPTSITFNETGPQVSLAPGPTEFISESRVKSSPAILLASIVGVSPQSLVKLTLNGAAQSPQTGKIVLHPPLSEGKNVFTLTAIDNKGRTAKATTEVYLDSSVPIISIQEPGNKASINAMWVDVHGTFAVKNLKQIRVENLATGMQAPALVRGNTFEARNVLLAPGTNTLNAIVENLAGNTGTNTIIVMGPTDTNAAQTFPIEVQMTPCGGFAPLAVTFDVTAHLPEKIQRVSYDFGDSTEQAKSDLQPVRHSYKRAGQYFPVVTVQTSAGHFSSISGGLAMFLSGPVGVNVQLPPEVLSTISVADPVDLKWSATNNLYVLSGSTATIAEFDGRGKLVRAAKEIGAKPSGLTIDPAGNVYVAVTGNNQVQRFKPTPDSFERDTSFGAGGIIGDMNGMPGSGSNQFNSPFDITLSRNGQTFLVSDSGNNRIQRFLTNGTLIDSIGGERAAAGGLSFPKGMAHDEMGFYLFLIDSGNNRIIFADESGDYFRRGTSGMAGTALGQFTGPTHLCANKRGLYVADRGNNRIQVFAHVESHEMHSPIPFVPRVALSGELGLKSPAAVAAIDDFLEEKIYVADTGNNRVLLIKLPLDNPVEVWNRMKGRLAAGDVQEAASCFTFTSKEKYQEAFLAMSKDELIATVKGMGSLKPATIESDAAQYYFESVVEGQQLTFPVEFRKEFGQWKIDEY